ncbi:S1 family peptidase [Draconibacterium sp.]|nr:S1 family peptidase [Draconibacterium sp.]
MSENTYIPRDEVVDINKEFDKVREKAKKELMKIPGVVAVGVGLKQVKGEFKRQPCFKVTVKKKKSSTALKSGEKIPDILYGFRTDVIEIAQGHSTVDGNKYRPLIGGSKIGTSTSSGYGTMGCLVSRNSDNKILLLSNWHVLSNNPDTVENDRVGQPSHNGCCSCCACNEIGKIVDGRFRTGDMDAAIALLNGQDEAADTIPEEKYLKEIINIGYIAGSAAPQSMETVYKYGARSEFTKGQITNDSVVTNILYDNYTPNVTISRSGQLEITPATGYPKFQDRGDSGSVTVNEKQEVIGLNYAANLVSGIGFATSIVPILSTLGITVLNTAFHSSVAGKEGVPLSSRAVPDFNIPNLASAFAEAEQELGQYSQGKEMIALFKQHREELLDLVNHKREVMAAWNRYQGPSFLAHVARSIRRDNKPIPEQIKGITLQNLLLKMTTVLQRNGSPELVRAVSDNYMQIMDVLSSGRSPEEWKAFIAKYDQMAYN